ncbi:MAG TPA: hypothetical protein DC054_19950 [Blastocatellia bacterium]|nr:hypothetical protein [Blastocatellia bacterium]
MNVMEQAKLPAVTAEAPDAMVIIPTLRTACIVMALEDALVRSAMEAEACSSQMLLKGCAAWEASQFSVRGFESHRLRITRENRGARRGLGATDLFFFTRFRKPTTS